MKRFFTKYFLLLLLVLIGKGSFSQNSLLVNFGSSTCSSTSSTDASFSIVKNPLTSTPTLLANCDFSAQIPNYFGVYIAYNPKDNKLYISSIQDFVHSKVWTLDVGLPNSITCPALIPVLPENTYNYVLNNFEFDNNGNLWAFSNYNAAAGTCLLSNFDLTTGTTLASKTVQFPAGHFPTDVLNGDLSILPNGRLFCTLGAAPSQLYEIPHYTGFGLDTAIYLQTMPLDCFGMAFLNGELEISGTDHSSSCYYFDYDIASNTLGAVQSFQNGLAPVDNTSLVPVVGATKKLSSSTVVNANTANLTYVVYLRNMGNVILNDINMTDDLNSAFGAGNVSNVTASFLTNPAGLVLNPSFNGTTVTSLLAPGQQLHNHILSSVDYQATIQINCQVTNLIPGVTYYNSAIAKGDIGSGPSFINISDSSNNGNPTLAVMDPNNNNNAGDPGENVPTPYVFPIILTVNFINADASLINNTSASINWSVATPTTSANKFDVEYSTDGKNWKTAGSVAITSDIQSDYNFVQDNIPSGNIYYRIKEIDEDGSYVYSRIILLNNNDAQTKYVVYPNPANNTIQVIAPYGISGNCTIELFDATGRKLMGAEMNTSSIEINTTMILDGSYLLRINHAENITTQKVLIIH